MTGDFNDKLNSILQNPAMMAQIKALADTMTAGEDTSSQENGESAEESAATVSGAAEEKTLVPPQRLDGLLSPAFEENIQNTCALLQSLRPFLDARRREKIDRVLQMIRLAQMASKFGGLL